MSEAHLQGGCLCGAVGFEADGPFATFQYCHCSRCRHVTGSAHASNIFCPPDRFRWTRGEDVVRQWDLPGARFFASAFCTTCGSTLPWKNQQGSMVIIPAGALEGEVPIRPLRNIMWGSRADWYVPVESLECHDTLPQRKE